MLLTYLLLPVCGCNFVYCYIVHCVPPKKNIVFDDNLKNTKLYNIYIYKDTLPGLKNILVLNGGIYFIPPFRPNIFF